MARYIYVKDFDQFISNKKDKTIKMILLVVEKHMQRNSREFSEIRNTILDGINDFYGDICLALENHELGDKDGKD